MYKCVKYVFAFWPKCFKCLMWTSSGSVVFLTCYCWFCVLFINSVMISVVLFSVYVYCYAS